MDLLQTLKQSKQELERLKCERKLLQRRIEGILHSAAPEAFTSLKHVEQLLKPLEHQWGVLKMNVTQGYRV